MSESPSPADQPIPPGLAGLLAQRLRALRQRAGRLKAALGVFAGVGALLGGLQGYYAVYRAATQPHSPTGAAAVAGAAPAGGSEAPHALSILVMPFQNQTGDAGKAYIAEGLSSAVASDLGRIREARVASFASNPAPGEPSRSIREIGRQAGVRFVLQGSVLASGSRLRLSAQLTDTQTGALVWSERFEAPAHDIFAIQDQFTSKVHHSVGTEMLLQAARASETRSTSAKVADLMLRARALALVRTDRLQDWQAAEQAYRAVLARDPDHPLALAGLARVLGKQLTQFKRELGPARVAALATESEALAQRAKRLDPDLPEAYAALAFVSWHRKDWDRAVRMQEMRLTLDPNNPAALLGLADAYALAGQHERALGVAQQALALDPKRPADSLVATLARLHFRLGQHADAIAWFLRAHENDADYRARTLPLLAVAHAMNGEPQKAAELVAQLRREQPQLGLARFLADAGELGADTQAWYAEVLAPAWRRAGLPP